MNNDSIVEFRCVNGECGEPLSFSIEEADNATAILCPSCGNEYRFNEKLCDKFRKFANLINAVRDAEDILGGMNVGLDFHGHSIQVPYRLLLTRLNTFLTLTMGDRTFNFRLRVEPLRDT